MRPLTCAQSQICLPHLGVIPYLANMLIVNQTHLVQPGHFFAGCRTVPEQRQLDSGDADTATPPNLRPPSRVPSRGTRERGRQVETGAAEQAQRGAEAKADLPNGGS